MPDIPASSSGQDGYVMDAENAAEMARLMLQDSLITRSMGGVLPEQIDLSRVYHVLDIACGPGGWLLNLVKQHPHIQGVGIDISHLMMDYAAEQAAQQGLANAQFHIMDVTQPLGFPDNTFDLVNGRILTGFLTTGQWSTLTQECSRITRPGGILRFTEVEWGFTNGDALDRLSEMTTLSLYRAGHSFSPHGRTVGTANVLRLLLKQAGYSNIQYKAHAVDYSAGAEEHDSNVQNALIVYKLIQPFFLQMQVTTEEELQRIYVQAEEEVQAEDFCAVDYYLTVWGYKSE